MLSSHLPLSCISGRWLITMHCPYPLLALSASIFATRRTLWVSNAASIWVKRQPGVKVGLVAVAKFIYGLIPHSGGAGKTNGHASLSIDCRTPSEEELLYFSPRRCCGYYFVHCSCDKPGTVTYEHIGMTSNM